MLRSNLMPASPGSQNLTDRDNRDQWLGKSSDIHSDDLIRRLRLGDPQAYEALFHQHYVILVDFAQSIVRHRSTAEEIVIDVIAWVYEHRATLAPRSSLSAYLFTAVRRRALTVLRGQRRAAARYVELEEMSRAIDIAPSLERTSEDVLIDAEDREAITQLATRLLNALGEPARTIVLLRITHKLSHAEIAEIMETTPEAVRAQFSRTIRHLRTIAGDDPRL